MDLPYTFMVVDVLTGSIVDAPPRCRYVSLSYVWGRTRTYRLMRKDRRSLVDADVADRLSKTTKDTLEVVKALGERYL